MMKAPSPRAKFDLGLRSVMSAGESVGVTVFEWAREELGVTINEMFGQTFNYVVGNCQSAWPAKPGSIGRPYPGHRVAVIDEQGKNWQPGELGEVAVNRSSAARSGSFEYWKNSARARSSSATGAAPRPGGRGRGRLSLVPGALRRRSRASGRIARQRSKAVVAHRRC